MFVSNSEFRNSFPFRQNNSSFPFSHSHDFLLYHLKPFVHGQFAPLVVSYGMHLEVHQEQMTHPEAPPFKNREKHSVPLIKHFVKRNLLSNSSEPWRRKENLPLRCRKNRNNFLFHFFSAREFVCSLIISVSSNKSFPFLSSPSARGQNNLCNYLSLTWMPNWTCPPIRFFVNFHYTNRCVDTLPSLRDSPPSFSY